MIKVLSNEEMRSFDEYTVKAGASERQLIANAAQMLFASAKYTSPVCIICGCGNNGSDGLALAPILKKTGKQVVVYLLSEKVSKEGAFYLEECKKAGINVEFFVKGTSFIGYNTVVDCIFGTGFYKKADGIYADAIRAVNESGAFVISADINSGLNGNSGMSEVYVISDLTVALGEYKYGHFLGSAKDAMKNKIRCDVGINTDGSSAFLLEDADIRKFFSKRKSNCHKGNFGYVAVIGGSLEYSGAPKLSNIALCALRSGCGICRLAVPDCISHYVLPYILESTLFPLRSENGHIAFDAESINGAISNCKCVCIGMGMGVGKAQENIIKHLLSSYKEALIIDADGLNCLSRIDGEILKSTSANVILTPHIKEFSRLCKKGCEEILSSPVSIAQSYAAENGVTLLLKGPCTIVTNGYETYLTDKGCSGMATAGSGDVLSGILAGIMGYTDKEKTAFAVAAGAYINGISGQIAQDEYTEIAMLSSDTAKSIPKALKYVLGE